MNPDEIESRQILPRQGTNGLPEHFEPRCKTCTSPHRHSIERLIALGTAHIEIERLFDVPRRSVSLHARDHLSYEQAAVREIIAHEAEQINANYEEGVKGALMYRSYLSTALKKAWDDLIEGNVRIDPSVAVQLIQQMDKFDKDAKSVAVEELNYQYQCFEAAVKKVLPREHWGELAQVYQELLDERTIAGLLPSGNATA